MLEEEWQWRFTESISLPVDPVGSVVMARQAFVGGRERFFSGMGLLGRCGTRAFSVDIASPHSTLSQLTGEPASCSPRAHEHAGMGWRIYWINASL